MPDTHAVKIEVAGTPDATSNHLLHAIAHLLNKARTMPPDHRFDWATATVEIIIER